jgi:hypothetical protein
MEINLLKFVMRTAVVLIILYLDDKKFFVIIL